MNTGLARITTQNSFCKKCINPIKNKIMEITNIKNVYLYPSGSLVVFNFNNANQISEVLNVLTALGYPEIGEQVSIYKQQPLCCCIN